MYSISYTRKVMSFNYDAWKHDPKPSLGTYKKKHNAQRIADEMNQLEKCVEGDRFNGYYSVVEEKE